jgi:micrococcal nuclease
MLKIISIAIIAATLTGADLPVLKVVDGDTFKLDKQYYRLARVDAPELFTYKCAKEYRKARDAKIYLERLFFSHPVEIKEGARDIYGRVLVELYLGTININDHMMKLGYARAYKGKRRSWCK